jgi:predicted Zn-dependent protease
MRRELILLTVFLLCFGIACNRDEPEPESKFVDLFYENATELTLNVAYEEDGEPYTEFNNKNAWTIAQSNLNTLLRPRGIQTIVPFNLGEMTYLGDLPETNFDITRLRSLAADVTNYDNESTQKGITVLFLNGYYERNGAVQDQVLGLNISGTDIVAIFKPVIEASSPSFTLRKLVEQSTVVHEIGHALGLVNNGVPITTQHQDFENGAHCSNEDCVMYFQNGGANVVEFVQPYISGGEIDLFGEDCKNDIAQK